MDGKDDMYTIELEDDGSDFYELEYSESEEDTQNSGGEKFEISPAPAVLSSGDKHAEFLRLRDSVCRMNRGPVHNRFLKQARKYEDVIARPCERVPFTCYWPTYEAMSEDQLAWYFYWRNCVRSGDYKRTDLSYIFVYTYEIINNVGVKNGEDGFLRLCSVWNAYRGIYPTIDKYFSSWAEDYYIINCKDGVADSFFERLAPEVLDILPDSVTYEYMLNSGRLFSTEYIARFTSYKFAESKFCGTEEGKTFIDILPAVLSSVNSLLLKSEGRGIFGMFKPGGVKGRQRLPYQNAVYQGPVRSLPVNASNPAANRDLCRYITSIIKLCENCCREAAGFRGRLGGIELPDCVKQRIKSFTAQKINSVKAEQRADITIDKSKIKKLAEDTEIVLGQLLADADIEYEDETGNAGQAAEAEIPPQRAEAFKDIQNTGNEQEITKDNIIAALKPYISENGVKILGYILEHGCEAGVAELSGEFAGVFVETEIDGINDAAIDAAGDIILIMEDGAVKLEI